MAASQGAASDRDVQRTEARHAALVRAVNRNVGHAHGTRGMNACTLLALHVAATPDDVPVLRRMLGERDRVAALTALHVLPTFGEAGIAAARAGVPADRRGEAEEAIRDAAKTVETIERYRAAGTCRIRR